METQIVAMTSNEAEAEAMRQINPEVVAAYPITPQTEIVQIFSGFVADGLVDTELIRVESEHSAMSACIGAAAAGVRAMTATSSQGLALMWEMLYIAASLRLPIVMAVVNRALSGNINIHCDHSDTMGARDCGWIQIYSENVQEAYDNLIQAVPIAEGTRLPVMVTTDGFILSHAMERVHLYPDEAVQEFIGEYEPAYSLLDVDHPITVGPLDLTDYYFEHKRSQAEAMRESPAVIQAVGEEFAAKFGTRYDLLEPYRLEDAQVAVVAMGSTAGTAKAVVNALRAEGQPVGLLKIRVFRPLPRREIVQSLQKVKAIAVMDRAEGFSGFGGPLLNDLRAVFYTAPVHPPIVDYIYGLGGRDVTTDQIRQVFEDLLTLVQTGEMVTEVSYLGLRSPEGGLVSRAEVPPLTLNRRKERKPCPV